MDGFTVCRKCGDSLTDIEWHFDPCPASADGDHETGPEGSASSRR